MTTQAAARSTKRQAIIETAERLFAEHGYDATSTARIAHEAGVPSGLVFYHFATKTGSAARHRPRAADARARYSGPRRAAARCTGGCVPSSP